MRPSHILLLLVTTLPASIAARAAEPAAADVATINGCLTSLDKKTNADIEKYVTGCLRKVAKPCAGNDLGGIDRKDIECYDRERSVWDKILNDSYKNVLAGLEPEQVTKLREVQRAWIQF